jgi:hypothetical protein
MRGPAAEVGNPLLRHRNCREEFDRLGSQPYTVVLGVVI